MDHGCQMAKQIFNIMPMYPHRIESYVIVVPTEYNEKSEILNYIIESPLFNIWMVTIILISIVRVLLQYFIHSKIQAIQVWFETIGITFGTTGGPVIHNRPERILILFLSIFSIISGIFFSGLLFKQFTISSYMHTINSLQDLKQYADIPIYVPEDFDDKLELNKEF